MDNRDLWLIIFGIGIGLLIDDIIDRRCPPPIFVPVPLPGVGKADGSAD